MEIGQNRSAGQIPKKGDKRKTNGFGANPPPPKMGTTKRQMGIGQNRAAGQIPKKGDKSEPPQTGHAAKSTPHARGTKAASGIHPPIVSEARQQPPCIRPPHSARGRRAAPAIHCLPCIPVPGAASSPGKSGCPFRAETVRLRGVSSAAPHTHEHSWAPLPLSPTAHPGAH